MASTEIVRIGVEIISEHLMEVCKGKIKKMQKKQQRKRRRWWTRPWVMRRIEKGASSNLLVEIAVEDPEAYRNHLRMSENQFVELYEKVKLKIQKQNTIMREALPAKLKLQITLRYLATGDSFGTLEVLYRVPRCTIGRFMPEVCRAIAETLEEYIRVSITKK